jgi:signal transduction histidine kinase
VPSPEGKLEVTKDKIRDALREEPQESRATGCCETMEDLERCRQEAAELRAHLQERGTELRAMAEQVARLSRYELASLLMGSLAYDVNNLLTVIKGYCEMMHDRMGDVVIQAEVEEVIKASDRAAGIVKQLLSLQLNAAHDQIKGMQSGKETPA